MAEITRKDLFDVLNEFYLKILEPRFDRIENRLNEHDQKFKDILLHFDQIYQRLERLETEYYAIKAGIDRIENRLDAMNNRLDAVENRLDAVENRLDKVENRLDKVEHRLDGLEKGQQEIIEKLNKEISIREVLEKEIKDLKHRLAILQERIEDLEKRLKTFS